MDKRKQAHALISLYVRLYTAKYSKAPQINRYRERWGFEAMIEDLGYERSIEVVEYFLSVATNHSVQTLLYKYDEISNTMQQNAAARERVEKLRRETQQRMESAIE